MAKRKKLVGGNKGAWAHAKEQAKGKKNPEAYAAAVYRNITKKSFDCADNIDKSAASILGEFLGQSKNVLK